MTFPPKSFWVDQWLRPHDAMLLVGREGIGKSTFLFQLLAHLTAGTPLFGLYEVTEPKRCHYIQLEGDKQETWIRLKAAEHLFGFNWANFEYSFLDAQRLEQPDGLALFCQAVQPYQRHIQVLVTDPWYGLFAGSGNDDGIVKNVLNNLRKLKEECNAAFISGHHIRKSIFDPKHGKFISEGAEDALGSRLIPAWFDTVFHLDGEGDTTRRIRRFKGRKGGYIDQVDFIAYEHLADPNEAATVWFDLNPEQTDSCVKLLHILIRQSELQTLEQMAQLAGVTKQTIQRWLKSPEVKEAVVCLNTAQKPPYYAHKRSPAYQKFGLTS